jgi:SAM-dependent methyltransferase
MVSMPCTVCASSGARPAGRVHIDCGTEYQLWGCDSCGVEFWTPFKNPGAEWYGHDERYAGRNQDPILAPNWNHKKVISFLAPRTGTVLDVGCGIGNFLAHAGAHGWNVRGIDFDPGAIEAGTSTFGLGGLEVSDLRGFRRLHPEEKFDLVTFFDVLEHLDNHRDFMSDVRAIVKDDGYLAMSMPYREGARWLIPYDLPPRHLTRWNRTSLTAFLRQEGFEPVYIVRRSEGFRFLILKLRFRYGKYLSFNLVGRAKSGARRDGQVVRVGTPSERRIRTLEKLAAIKDALIFGIPAFLVWLAMIASPKRYVTLYCIAKKQYD